jgi:hypothetical protein
MISEQGCGRDAPQPAVATRRDRHVPGQVSGKSPVPAALLLAVVPLVLFGGPAAVSAPPQPIPVKAVQVEGVRVIRMDSQTFSGRWRPMYDVPPAIVIHEVHELKGGDAPQEITGKPVVAVARPLPPAVRTMKRASLRPTETCARHGMRKMTYTVRGYQHWRCRR